MIGVLQPRERIDTREFNDFTLFDIFNKKGFIYLIMSINNDPISHNDISVSIDNKELNFVKKYEKNNKEPILIFTYAYSDKKDVDVNIKYKLINRTFIAQFVSSEKKGFLALTTLFKNDYVYFSTYYDYYMKQGVDHFYMYYNGKITQQIKDRMNFPNVTLIEWDFRYWNCRKTYKWGHHAQVGQLSDAIYRFGKDNYDYMVFNDMDEYFYIDNYTLTEYIRKFPRIATFGFCNIWSKLINNTIQTSSQILIGSKKRYKCQSKNIYKLNNIKLIGIHEPYSFFKRTGSITNLNMYHFYSWNKTRTANENWKKINFTY
jgi:hypothetical protein